MKTHSLLVSILLTVALLVAVPSALFSQQVDLSSPAKMAEARQVADRLFDIGKTEDAKAIYLRIASSYANDFAFNKRLAHCFFISRKAEMDKAARYYARAYQLNPKDPEVELNLGKAYTWSKQYAEAVSVFRRIVARDPSNGEAWLELARAQNYGGQPQAAKATYEGYLSRFPGDREVRLEYAAFLGWSKQPEAALQQYRLVLKADPYNLKARLGAAQILGWQGKLKESLQAYEEILRSVPNHYDALRGKAFVLFWLQRYEEAGRVFAQVTEQKPPDREMQDVLRQIARWRAEEPARLLRAEVDALRQQAEAAVGRNDLPRAIELLNQAAARMPQDAPLRLRLGELYTWNQQWDEAIETFRKLTVDQPDNLVALRELGNAQAGAKRLADAAATLRAYLARSPDTGVRLSLANVLSWSANFADAITMYQQILQSEPDNFGAALGLAQALAWQGKHEEALEQFDALLARRPGNREALLGKAQVLYWTGNLEKSLVVLETMRETWPQDREIASVLQSVRDAEHQRALQQAAAQKPVNVDESIQRYQEILSRNPNDSHALQVLGDLYTQKGDFSQAISYYDQALAKLPNDVRLRQIIAKVASWNRDFNRSINLYSELVQQDPANREYHLELAKILSWAGRNTESVEQYREILIRDPNDVESRLGLARVLSWNKQLEQSLEEYARVLQSDPQNRDALIEQARVYSWRGDLNAALSLYNDLLIRMPEDRDARFGKAQTLYWAGQPREARPILAELQTRNPRDRDVALTLAGVQAALGRRDLALRQLDELDRMQPGNVDAERMRQSIRQDLRPVLILGITPSLDAFDLKIYYNTATLFFSPSPQVRSYLFTGIIPSFDSRGHEAATGREFLFGSYARVTHWLLVRGEAGLNSGIPGKNEAIGGGGATFFLTDNMQLDFDVSRRFINYIPRPVRGNISRVQLRAAWDWRPQRKWGVHLDYYHQRYSDTNRNNGMNLSIMRNLVNGERFQLETGYLYAVSGFTKDINSGFFAPDQFQRHAALANVRAKLTNRLGMSFWGSLGREQIFSDPFRLDGTARVSWDYTFSHHFKFTWGYGYFAIASIARAGAYTTHTGYASLEFRF